MLRRLGLKTVFVVIALLALAVPALAGGVVVSLDGTVSGAIPGDPFEIGFTIISAHDGSSQTGMQPIVMLANTATGETLEVTAQPDGEAGHYTAVVTLPSEGQWSLAIQPRGKFAENYPPPGMTPTQASSPAAAESALPNTGRALNLPTMTQGQVIVLGLAGGTVLPFAMGAWLKTRRGGPVRP